MRIEFDSKLKEQMVMQEIQRRNMENDDALEKEYHKLGDPLYDLPVDEREEEFEKIHHKFFLRFGYEKAFSEAMERFPALKEKIGYLNITESSEEEANIMRKNPEDASDLSSIRIKMRPELFVEKESLQKTLRHELMHITDMLDKDYGYMTKIKATNPTEECFIRDRYRVIWDIYIDSRLAKEGKDLISNKDRRFAEFQGFYQKFPYSQRVAVFEGLWNMEKMTHQEIIDMANNPVELLEKSISPSAEIKKNINIPGSLCPMCKFPTYHWVKELNHGSENDKKVIDKIKEDFPAWDPAEGGCERCMELYSMKAEVTLASLQPKSKKHMEEKKEELTVKEEEVAEEEVFAKTLISICNNIERLSCMELFFNFPADVDSNYVNIYKDHITTIINFLDVITIANGDGALKEKGVATGMLRLRALMRGINESMARPVFDKVASSGEKLEMENYRNFASNWNEQVMELQRMAGQIHYPVDFAPLMLQQLEKPKDNK